MARRCNGRAALEFKYGHQDEVDDFGAKEGGKLIARERKKRGRVKKEENKQKIGLVVRDYYTFCRIWYVPGKREMRELASS